MSKLIPAPWCETKILPHPYLSTFAGRGKPTRGEADRDKIAIPRRWEQIQNILFKEKKKVKYYFDL